MEDEWRAEEGPFHRDPRDPLDAGRNRYDSATWRRIYDSFVWTWVVGPIVYGTVVAAVWVVIFGNSTAEGIVFGVFMTLFVLAGTALHERRRNRTDSG